MEWAGDIDSWGSSPCSGDKYGHDQIQFNNALSRSGLVWEERARDLTQALR